VADTERIIALVEDAQRPGLQVAAGGQVVQVAQQGEIGSEGIGLAAAAVILLLVFGSVVAAGLPILVAVVGLGISASLVGVFLGVRYGFPDAGNDRAGATTRQAVSRTGDGAVPAR
jgi:RND superfamily putative drug exporter